MERASLSPRYAMVLACLEIRLEIGATLEEASLLHGDQSIICHRLIELLLLNIMSSSTLPS